jgi:hypothetical protein
MNAAIPKKIFNRFNKFQFIELDENNVLYKINSTYTISDFEIKEPFINENLLKISQIYRSGLHVGYLFNSAFQPSTTKDWIKIQRSKKVNSEVRTMSFENFLIMKTEEAVVIFNVNSDKIVRDRNA